MLILVTGVPGAGKTLNTIKQVLTEGRFKDRAVYFCNIDGCSVPGWTEISLDDCKDWINKLPPKSVLIIDESYKFAPVQATGTRPPGYIEKLAEHRHYGIDIIFICQHPTQLNTFVRKMVGNHFHYERKFGLSRSLRFEWQEVQADPQHWSARRDALKKQISFDKKMFALYKSAEVHTHKRRIPFKVVGAVLTLLVSIGLIGRVFYNYSYPDGAVGAPVQAQSLAGILASSGEGRKPVLTRDQYVEQYRARVAGLPYTAPVYDAVFQVKTFPKPNCVVNMSTGSCRCYTQQGTRYEAPIHVCMSIVQNGWFDPTRDDARDVRSAQPARPVASAAPVASDNGSIGRVVLLDRTMVPGTSAVPLEEKTGPH